MYPGLFNSSYIPSPEELQLINDPVNQLGPRFLSAAFSLLLNGIIMAQTYNYVERTIADSLQLRALVYGSFLLCTAKSADTIIFTWRTFVKMFGEYAKIVSDPHLDENIAVVWSALIGLLVQSYFIHRIFLLSRNWYLLAAASVAAVGGLIGSIVLCVALTIQDETHRMESVSGGVMIIGAALADALVTGFTCWYFYKQRQTSSFPGTKVLIGRLVTISMQSATPPFICAICNLIFHFRPFRPDREWVMFFNMVMPYLYTISLIFTLNSRPQSRDRGNSQSNNQNVYNPHPVAPPKPASMNENRATEVYVSITRQTRHDQLHTPSSSLDQKV